MIEYERFRIPPDFDLVQLHQQASYLYDDNSKAVEICPCCEKFKRQKRIPFSAGTQSLTQLGQEIPMLFYFLKATSIFLFCLVIAKFGDYQICNLVENQCQIIYASFVIPQVGTFDIPAGFKQANDALSFAQFIIFILGIIGLKIAIKMKKYKVKQLTKQSISNRTLKLINVHKQCTAKQIKQALSPYKVDVVLTYRVKQFQECLLKINKLLKMKIMKKQKDGSFITQSEQQINQKMRRQKEILMRIKKELKLQKNRLSIAFVVFASSAQKREVYKKLKRSIIGRLFYKLCTCCSDTQIRGQSFTVKPADEPSDIIWVNLENPYLRTKIRRLLSVFVCFVLLMFGIATQYLFTEIANENTFVGPIVKSAVVLVLNFIIVTLLEYSTENMEHYESHTERHLTLVKKMTAFLFINISLSPLLGYAFSLDISQQQESIRSVLFANFCFSVLVLAIGNITKPFPLWFSVERVLKSLTRWLNKRKGHQCILTQIEANKQFQPIEFPISTLYSLALSSLLMVCFYVNVFQILILVEMVSLVIMFLVGKWMLLRVCKSPAGLARRINNLAQSLLRIVIFIYWFGKVLLNYINLTEDQKQQYDGIIGYTFRNAYGYIQFIFTIVCIFLLEFFVAWISRFILGKMHERKVSKKSSSEQRLIQNKKNQKDDIQDQFQVTYANANLHLKLQDEFKKFQQSEKEIKTKQKKKQQKYFR